MAVYATYAQYTGTYHGAAIASADFDRLVLKASAVIDRLTFNRAGAVVETGTDTDTIALITLATCAVAEECQILSKTENGGEIASERVGNHSVTYVQSASASRSDIAKMADAASLFLSDTGLMYRGFGG